MLGIRINGKLHIPPAGLQCLDQLFRLADGDDIIQRTVEVPDRHRLEFTHARREPVGPYAAAADRGNRRKSLRMLDGQIPRAITAHAKPGQIHAGLIHLVLVGHHIKYPQQGITVIGPPVILRALGRHGNEREIILMQHDSGDAVGTNSVDVLPAFARPMQE